MAYTKHTWETGEIIDAEKLNHIEDGIESGKKYPIITIDTDINHGACGFVKTDNGHGTHTYYTFEELLNIYNSSDKVFIVKSFEPGNILSILSYSPGDSSWGIQPQFSVCILNVLVAYDTDILLTIRSLEFNSDGTYSVQEIQKTIK